MSNRSQQNLADLFHEFCFNVNGFSAIIIDTRRGHQVTDMDRVTMVVAAVAVVILLQILPLAISEVVVMQEMATPTIGGRTKITTGGNTIEDHRRQMPTPSASFFLGCDTVSKPFCV